jgi:3-hydroxyisobutyrate dehydrogenase-like beta-hydroxyacid dehydrogenase
MTSRTKKNVGVIGLGIIGSRVREVLRRKGFHAFVWNRTPRPVPNFVGAPAELAEMCDHIQIFVSDDDALLDVVRQLAPGLFPRHIVIAHPTVTPHSMIAAAEIVERRGARFLEAPFTGSKEAAENGQLVYYVGGEEAAVREARPTLEASSKEIVVIGEVGQATVIKITTNMITAASVQAAAEALALMQTAGLPLEKFIEAMKGNASNSKTLDLKLPKMIDGKFDPHFSVKHMLKDMQIASRMGLSHHLELGVTSAARDRLLEQMQRGHGDEDYSAIARKYFPDVAPSGQPEADLELFEPRLAPVEPAWVELPSNHQSPEVVPAVGEAMEQRHDVDLAQTAPEPVAASVEMPKPETATEPVDDRQQNGVEEEPEQRRGLLDRLLRRESNS